jgi:AcrR family transcriptional regulator
MSSNAADLSTEAPRRELSDRQARTVEGLTVAATKELRTKGYDGLTVRNVARRAGVAPATAYTYFASKEHLVTESFWRRLKALPAPRVNKRRGVGSRVTGALADVASLAAEEPDLFAACTIAMVADDPDVRRLRDKVGAELHKRFVVALGDEADDAALFALDLAMSGAMIRAGTGHMSYAEIPARMAEVAELIVRGER